MVSGSFPARTRQSGAKFTLPVFLSGCLGGFQIVIWRRPPTATRTWQQAMGRLRWYFDSNPMISLRRVQFCVTADSYLGVTSSTFRFSELEPEAKRAWSVSSVTLFSRWLITSHSRSTVRSPSKRKPSSTMADHGTPCTEHTAVSTSRCWWPGVQARIWKPLDGQRVPESHIVLNSATQRFCRSPLKAPTVGLALHRTPLEIWLGVSEPAVGPQLVGRL